MSARYTRGTTPTPHAADARPTVRVPTAAPHVTHQVHGRDHSGARAGIRSLEQSPERTIEGGPEAETAENARRQEDPG